MVYISEVECEVLEQPDVSLCGNSTSVVGTLGSGSVVVPGEVVAIFRAGGELTWKIRAL